MKKNCHDPTAAGNQSQSGKNTIKAGQTLHHLCERKTTRATNGPLQKSHTNPVNRTLCLHSAILHLPARNSAKMASSSSPSAVVAAEASGEDADADDLWCDRCCCCCCCCFFFFLFDDFGCCCCCCCCCDCDCWLLGEATSFCFSSSESGSSRARLLKPKLLTGSRMPLRSGEAGLRPPRCSLSRSATFCCCRR